MEKGREYWKTPSENEYAGFDEDLIDDLNERYDGTGDQDRGVKKNHKIYLRIIAFVTVIVFSLLVFKQLFTIIDMPAFDFIESSLELLQNPKIRTLREGVVEVSTINSQGTGFNIHEDGLIITNSHVVGNAQSAKVVFYRGDSYNGIVEANYPEIDLALLRIQGKNLPIIKLETGQELKAGEKVTVIGNPLWFSRIVTEGFVAGETTLKGWNIPVLLIQAPIYRGSSGSPVINVEGKVVAVIFATLASRIESEEIFGLAVPIDYLLEANNAL